MHKLSLYIDSTIPNYVFNDHTPDKQKAAKQLFSEERLGKFSIFISQVIIEELDASSEPKRSSMLQLIRGLGLLEINREIEKLAKEYIKQGIIPIKNPDDARHIAVASFYEVDAIVSYNFEHIVRIKTIDKVTGVNLL